MPQPPQPGDEGKWVRKIGERKRYQVVAVHPETETVDCYDQELRLHTFYCADCQLIRS